MSRPPVRRGSAAAVLSALSALAALAALAAPGASGAEALLDGADLALGERLIAQHRCSACHVRRVGGDGSAIYRPGQRLTTTAELRGMVEQCNTELGLQMFPDEVSAVAAVLQRDHYRLPEP